MKMKMSRLSGSELLAAVLLLLNPLPASAMLDCRRMRVDDHTFDFGALRGPHSVVTSAYNAITNKYTNTTYTLDLCAPLKRKSDVPKDEECPNGSRVCAITHVIDPTEEGKNRDVIDYVVPIAGAPMGGQLDYELTRLSTSDSAGDSDKVGVRLVLKGGRPGGQEQRASVELLCNQTMTGLEGEWDPEDVYIPGDEETTEEGESESRLRRREDDKAGEGEGEGEGEGWSEKQLKKDGAALVWDKYEEKPDHKLKVLHLTWHTKYACESLDDDEPLPGERKAHWGFFTWMVIFFFLATASYLIFGSWLNYNRYGARGWDLLPHGDTIRDIPYLLKDWTRRLLNTVQGSGSRGGYSAV